MLCLKPCNKTKEDSWASPAFSARPTFSMLKDLLVCKLCSSVLRRVHMPSNWLVTYLQLQQNMKTKHGPCSCKYALISTKTDLVSFHDEQGEQSQAPPARLGMHDLAQDVAFGTLTLCPELRFPISFASKWTIQHLGRQIPACRQLFTKQCERPVPGHDAA